MCSRLTAMLFVAASLACGVIIDRIAIVVGNAVIKDSDIERDIRVTEFINGTPLSLGEAPRKTAAQRLLDQAFIRREIRLGDYAMATPEEADQQLEDLKRRRFKSDTAYQVTLRRYGLTDPDLRFQFQWQLTVLRFVDVRFRPAAYVSDDDVEKYFQEHEAELKRRYPTKSDDELKLEARNNISGEKENQLFFNWLDEQRKSTTVKYYEENLK